MASHATAAVFVLILLWLLLVALALYGDRPDSCTQPAPEMVRSWRDAQERGAIRARESGRQWEARHGGQH